MSLLFDPQRNLLTTLLAGGIGLLGTVLVGQAVFMGRVDMDAIEAAGGSNVMEGQVDVPETGLESLDRYTAITDRPVFFSDRRLPVVEMVAVDEEEAPPDLSGEDGTVDDLRAVVAGIIITPDVRLAMVRDQAANKTVMLREGMSLDGDQAAWRLDLIEPRRVQFVSVDGRESELELKVNTAGLSAGASTPPARSAAQQRAEARLAEGQPEAATTEGGDMDARARAEEVRRRVAERRAELRAEAERRAQLQQQRQDN